MARCGIDHDVVFEDHLLKLPPGEHQIDDRLGLALVVQVTRVEEARHLRQFADLQAGPGGLNRLGRLAPALAQPRGLAVIGVPRLPRRLQQGIQLFLAGVERGEVGVHAFRQGGKRIDRNAVLARRRPQGEEPLLGALQLLGIEFGLPHR